MFSSFFFFFLRASRPAQTISKYLKIKVTLFREGNIFRWKDEISRWPSLFQTKLRLSDGYATCFVTGHRPLYPDLSRLFKVVHCLAEIICMYREVIIFCLSYLKRRPRASTHWFAPPIKDNCILFNVFECFMHDKGESHLEILIERPPRQDLRKIFLPYPSKRSEFYSKHFSCNEQFAWNAIHLRKWRTK